MRLRKKASLVYGGYVVDNKASLVHAYQQNQHPWATALMSAHPFKIWADTRPLRIDRKPSLWFFDNKRVHSQKHRGLTSWKQQTKDTGTSNVSGDRQTVPSTEEPIEASRSVKPTLSVRSRNPSIPRNDYHKRNNPRTNLSRLRPK